MIVSSSRNGGFLCEGFDLDWMLFCKCGYSGSVKIYGHYLGRTPSDALIWRFLLVGAEVVSEMGCAKGRAQWGSLRNSKYLRPLLECDWI